MPHSHEHSHEHSHNHDGHSHSHNLDVASMQKTFIFAIALNAIFVVVEAVIGIFSDSLSLLADAGHNLTDTAGLLISFLAFKISSAKPTDTYTYGYKKSTVLAALTNAVILFATVVIIIYEAYHRFNSPVPVSGKIVMITATIGILINGITAMLFFFSRAKDINIKGAFLHMLADALVSLGVVISGALIILSGYYWIDSAVSLVIAVVIFLSTWGLFKQSVRMSMDGVPHDITLEKITSEILTINGVAEVHHLHIWALSTTENALTAHIVLSPNVKLNEISQVKAEIKHLMEHNGIQHCTLETECAEENCESREH
ncbi:cation efflux system protein [Fibrobacterales bacterium]|nr:cation efflux system protein [Fibrobacterales bacterium]